MSWEPINLATLEPRPATLPTIGGVHLVYPGKRHIFSGPPESAKTLAAYAIALEEIRLGGNVLLIDFEMGRWDARDRLREMGATDDNLERFFYLEPETPASEEILGELAERWTFSLVILDAAAGAFDLQALDDNKRADAEAFSRTFVRPFWLRGIATLVLDHVSKNAKSRGGFAIGSERKVGGADVHLGFETVLPISRGGRGLYKVTTHKDRLGHLDRPKAAELELRSDPSTDELTWTFRTPVAASEDTTFGPRSSWSGSRNTSNRLRPDRGTRSAGIRSRKRPGKGPLRPPRVGRTRRRGLRGGNRWYERLSARQEPAPVPQERPRPHLVPASSQRRQFDPSTTSSLVPRLYRRGRGRGRRGVIGDTVPQ
jgi:hypothetical protein